MAGAEEPDIVCLSPAFSCISCISWLMFCLSPAAPHSLRWLLLDKIRCCIYEIEYLAARAIHASTAARMSGHRACRKCKPIRPRCRYGYRRFDPSRCADKAFQANGSHAITASTTTSPGTPAFPMAAAPMVSSRGKTRRWRSTRPRPWNACCLRPKNASLTMTVHRDRNAACAHHSSSREARMPSSRFGSRRR